MGFVSKNNVKHAFTTFSRLSTSVVENKDFNFLEQIRDAELRLLLFYFSLTCPRIAVYTSNLIYWIGNTKRRNHRFINCIFLVNHGINKLINDILQIIVVINRVIINRVLMSDEWFGPSTCDPLAASCPPAFADEWFSRSTCGLPAASCPP